MKTGTKSVLFGAHAFWLHPFAVAAAWTKLYGFPWDPRLWIAFFVHDLGYIGKENMDDERGETHPELGANIMSVFGSKWHDFTLLHSRYYAKRLGRSYSRLCIADKLATGITPIWLYVPMVIASGEIKEYMRSHPKYEQEYLSGASACQTPWSWFAHYKTYIKGWVDCHKHEAVDPWDVTIQSA